MTKEEAPPQNELYRKNVSLITIKGSQFLLVNLTVWPPDYWKFPQGGVHPGESLETAARREFQEELGNDKMRIISKSEITRRYRWEKPILIDGIEYVGQDQTFFISEFLGTDNDILLKNDEIRQFCWAGIQSLKRLIRRPQLDFQDYWETVRKILFEQHILELTE